jgi:hypothetical protein
MDPCTLRPVEGVLQATVISPSATDSGALSNALFASGPQDRALLLEQRPQGFRSDFPGKSTHVAAPGHTLACRNCRLASPRSCGSQVVAQIPPKQVKQQQIEREICLLHPIQWK